MVWVFCDVWLVGNLLVGGFCVYLVYWYGEISFFWIEILMPSLMIRIARILCA